MILMSHTIIGGIIIAGVAFLSIIGILLKYYHNQKK